MLIKLKDKQKRVFAHCSVAVVSPQGAEEKGLRSPAGATEAVGLVSGAGADDVGAVARGDRAPGQDRTRRAQR